MERPAGTSFCRRWTATEEFMGAGSWVEDNRGIREDRKTSVVVYQLREDEDFDLDPDFWGKNRKKSGVQIRVVLELQDSKLNAPLSLLFSSPFFLKLSFFFHFGSLSYTLLLSLLDLVQILNF